MKRILFAALAVVLAVGFAGTVNAKKMYLLNFDKGGMPNDNNNVDCSLAEDKAPKGQIYLKLVAIKPDAQYWCGEYAPKKANWDGYDVIKFDYFNEDKGPTAINFVVKPKGSDYNTRFDASIVARPGKGSVEIEIAGACGNGGNPIDWKTPIGQWNISGMLKAPLHIGNVTLETTEDEADEKKK